MNFQTWLIGFLYIFFSPRMWNSLRYPLSIGGGSWWCSGGGLSWEPNIANVFSILITWSLSPPIYRRSFHSYDHLAAASDRVNVGLKHKKWSSFQSQDIAITPATRNGGELLLIQSFKSDSVERIENRRRGIQFNQTRKAADSVLILPLDTFSLLHDIQVVVNAQKERYCYYLKTKAHAINFE